MASTVPTRDAVTNEIETYRGMGSTLNLAELPCELGADDRGNAG
jgi:hypothetical protein